MKPAGCSAWILAGGAGRRIGTPKAVLRLQGRSLLARTARLLRQCGLTPGVLGPCSLRPVLAQDGLPALPILPDPVPGCGPLPAIAHALRHSRSEWMLIVACDYPLLDPRLLRVLLETAATSPADAVLPRSADGHLQPLCALYRTRVERRLRHLVHNGSRRVFDLVEAITVDAIPWPTLARSGCRKNALLNLNYRDQLRSLQR